MMLDIENSMKDLKVRIFRLMDEDSIKELFDAKEVLEINVNIFMLKKKSRKQKISTEERKLEW